MLTTVKKNPSLRGVRLAAVTPVASGVSLFAFDPLDEGVTEAHEPGAHVDLHLPGGLVRQYSLVIDPDQSYPIVVAVKRMPSGRGGSRTLHDEVQVGSVLQLGGPRNHFRLVEGAQHSVLVAGGIGIVPLWSMLNRMEALGRPVELHYACQSRADMAFHEQLAGREHVTLHVDAEVGYLMDVAAICKKAPSNAHLYCCGPNPMLDAFERATAGRLPSHVHVESFVQRGEQQKLGGFEIQLARSRCHITVEHGESIVGALRRSGIDVSVSCEQGVCGACETRVLAGTPDHRCQVLSASERELGRTMMICCGASMTERLVLDL